MKIYTKTGDDGTTSLVGGTRVLKCSPRLEAYGTVDELNSSIGLLLAMEGIPSETRSMLQTIQHKLFNLGSQLATEPSSKWQPKSIDTKDIDMLERAIDAIDSDLPRHNQFILPGGNMAAAQANVARTVARRAERRMLAMRENGDEVTSEAMKFVNRLSDFLFVVGRQINIYSKNVEIFWNKDC